MAYMDRSVGVAAGFFSALLIALGLVGAGWLVGEGIIEGRRADSHVQVKGLAERDVKADLALWPIKFQVTGNDLAQIQARIETDLQTVQQFLRDSGFTEEEIQRQSLQIQDFGAGYGGNRPEERYGVSQSVLVRSEKVDQVEGVSRRLGELVAQGIVLQQDWNATGPTYVFTRLNEIKPDMLAEATASAREAANQFAEDAAAELGGIRDANQGVFVILPRDDVPGSSEQAQIFKTVRVVSTITYSLEN